MAIGIRIKVAGGTAEMIDRLNAEIDPDGNPPDGLLFHASGPVDDIPVAGAAQLGAHERPALAGLDVLELEDLEDRAVDLDVVPVLELVGVDRHGGPVYAEAAAAPRRRR